MKQELSGGTLFFRAMQIQAMLCPADETRTVRQFARRICAAMKYILEGFPRFMKQTWQWRRLHLWGLRTAFLKFLRLDFWRIPNQKY